MKRAERDLRQRRKRPCDHRGRQWSDAATAKDTWSPQELEEPLKGAPPCPHLDSTLPASRAMSGYVSVVKPSVCGVLLHWPWQTKTPTPLPWGHTGTGARRPGFEPGSPQFPHLQNGNNNAAHLRGDWDR